VAVIVLLLSSWWSRLARELIALAQPADLRAHGVIVVSERVLQGRSAPIGVYLGHPIWASVRFMGMEYRFDRVVDPRTKARIDARELLLAPGRVYVTD
jgi:hypothetical protein